MRRRVETKTKGKGNESVEKIESQATISCEEKNELGEYERNADVHEKQCKKKRESEREKRKKMNEKRSERR